MPMIVSAQGLVEAAMREVRTYSADDVLVRLRAGECNVQLVDIREARELQAGGTAVGACHAPRGLLEFLVDPASAYHQPLFANEAKEFVLFCGVGWRSALAAKSLQDMGMRNVAHIDGGVHAMNTAGFEWTDTGR
jgi:rhodanese-related sulfurtransferase